VNLKAEFTKKMGPLPIWAWALIGGAGMWVLLHKKAGTPAATTGMVPLVYSGGGFNGSGSDGGTGGGIPPPPTPLPPPVPPPNPPTVLGILGSGGSWGQSRTIPYGNAAAGQTGSMTYSTYDTPSGGAPTPSNPTPEMAGWTPQQWQDYAQGLATEWGLSLSQVERSLGMGSQAQVPQAQAQLPAQGSMAKSLQAPSGIGPSSAGYL
jgi:hypothetical protein